MITGKQQQGGIKLWLGGGVVLLCAIVLGGCVGFWLFSNLWFQLSVNNQPMAIQLTGPLPVTAKVTNVLDILLDGQLHAKVPFDQDLTVPFDGKYPLDISLDTHVPVNFAVDYDGVIHVNTQATIQANTTLDFKTIKDLRHLHVKTTIPLKFDLPVHLHIPVHDNLHFKYNGPVVAEIHQDVPTHVDTILDVSLPVDQTVSAPVTRSFGMLLHLPHKPLRATMNHADLKLGLDSLRLEKAKDNSIPKRTTSPYGPAADD